MSQVYGAVQNFMPIGEGGGCGYPAGVALRT